MRKIIALLSLLAFLPTASARDPIRLRVRAGPDIYHSSLMSSPGSFAVRPKVGVDYTFRNGISFLGEIGHQRISYGPSHLGMTSLASGVGYRMMEGRLLLAALLSVTSFTYQSYSSSSSTGTALRASYDIPLGQESRFSIVPMFGMDWRGRVTLQRDTGVPVSSSGFTNAMCSLFTFGLASSCGNVMEYLSVPASREYMAGAHLQYLF